MSILVFNRVVGSALIKSMKIVYMLISGLLLMLKVHKALDAIKKVE